MKKTKIIFLILFSISLNSFAQKIYNKSHSTLFTVNDSVVYDKKNKVYLFLNEKNKIYVDGGLTIAEIQGDGAVYDYIANEFVGYIGENNPSEGNRIKIMDADKNTIGFIYPSFGNIDNDKKSVIAYFDEGINYKILALTIFFFKDLDKR